MLTQEDIKQIGEEVCRLIEDNVLPAIEATRQELNERIDGVEERIGGVESRMVTKEYLDDKLFDLKGDIITGIRKEDKKVNRLIELLQTKQVLEPAEATALLEAVPFTRSNSDSWRDETRS